MVELSAFAITFFLALGLSLLITPLMIRMGVRLGIVTRVTPRRVNEGDARSLSKLGGGTLFVSFVLTVLLAQLLDVPRFDPNEPNRLIGLLLGSCIMFVVGVVDDWIELRPLPLLAAQFVAAAVAVHFEIFIEGFNNPLTGDVTSTWPFAFTVGLTLFWILGMINTVNWLDGLDGLSSGVVFIVAVVLFINSAFVLVPPQKSVSLLPLALMGSTLGFLLYNFYPARIFAGGGAMLLGYIIACLSIIGGAKMATVLMVMALPIMDTAWQIINRLMTGRSPFKGDRGHIHHRLLDLGFSQRQIVLGYYVFCTFFGSLTLVLESRSFKLISLLIMLLIILVGFGLVWMATPKQQKGRENSHDLV
ncbi:MAG: undecaprenyl-phosphate alpha-N-acetylglucosaminyl 1-phosphate transferase [Anaerolineaceae bacterium]|nr:undecaprenyl-phosphate alpha-N-acetylglucosaminyl 1-phosphate transferase [Anaerolineaceae bacterium]